MVGRQRAGWSGGGGRRTERQTDTQTAKRKDASPSFEGLEEGRDGGVGDVESGEQVGDGHRVAPVVAHRYDEQIQIVLRHL